MEKKNMQRDQNPAAAAVFDLDGTLLNSLEDLRDGVNFAMKQMGFPQRSTEEMRRFVGNGIGRMVGRAVPEGTSAEKTAACLGLFREYYEEHMADKTRPYAGIPQMLSGLMERGVRVAVVSNKYDAAVKALCGRFFGRLVEVTVGDHPGSRKKPAPDNVFEALLRLGVPPERALYAGDSDVDMETAKNAGLISVGVLWGFRDREELLGAGARHLASEPADILRLADDLWCGSPGGSDLRS